MYAGRRESFAGRISCFSISSEGLFAAALASLGRVMQESQKGIASAELFWWKSRLSTMNTDWAHSLAHSLCSKPLPHLTQRVQYDEIAGSYIYCTIHNRQPPQWQSEPQLEQPAGAQHPNLPPELLAWQHPKARKSARHVRREAKAMT